MEAIDSYIESLRKDIEDLFDKSFRSPTDFDNLSRMIAEKGGDTLSPSTLKRIWGYTKVQPRPMRSTLTILASVLGYRDWEAYVEKKQSEGRIESGFVSEADISAISCGDTLSFRWNPDRSITLLSLGDERFEVARQENSSLRVGDTFRLTFVREGYPVYCKDVIRGGESLGDYVAGEHTGIRELTLVRKGSPRCQD